MASLRWTVRRERDFFAERAGANAGLGSE